MSRVAETPKPTAQQIINALDELWEIKLEEIPNNWIGVMAKRLLKELNRQIAAAENAKLAGLPVADRAKHAQTLSTLQTTLDKLVRLEKQRRDIEGTNEKKYDDAVAEVERIVDRAITASGQKAIFGRADTGEG